MVAFREESNVGKWNRHTIDRPIQRLHRSAMAPRYSAATRHNSSLLKSRHGPHLSLNCFVLRKVHIVLKEQKREEKKQ